MMRILKWMCRHQNPLLKIAVVLLMFTCILMAFYITVQSDVIDMLWEELDTLGPYIEDIPEMLEQQKVPI